jgi:hypothetical protein
MSAPRAAAGRQVGRQWRCQKEKPVQKVVPTLRVRSYEMSRALYAKLGLEEKWTHQSEPKLPVLAFIARDGAFHEPGRTATR